MVPKPIRWLLTKCLWLSWIVIRVENDIESLSKFTTQNNNVDFAGRLIYKRYSRRRADNFGKYKRSESDRCAGNRYGLLWLDDEQWFLLHTKKVLTNIKVYGFPINKNMEHVCGFGVASYQTHAPLVPKSGEGKYQLSDRFSFEWSPMKKIVFAENWWSINRV